LVTSELDFLKGFPFHKYRIGNNQRNGFPEWILETPELDFLKGFPFHKYRIGNNPEKWVSTMDFHFASTELVTIQRNGFPQWISMSQV
jgi:hypothetical protein